MDCWSTVIREFANSVLRGIWKFGVAKTFEAQSAGAMKCRSMGYDVAWWCHQRWRGPPLEMPRVSQNCTFVNLVGPISSPIRGAMCHHLIWLQQYYVGLEKLKGSGVQRSEEMREGVKFSKARSSEASKFRISTYQPSAWSQPVVTLIWGPKKRG